MSIRAMLFLLTLSIAALLAAVVAGGATVLAVLGRTPLAAALARGGVVFAATLTLAVAVIGLAYTVLG